MSLKDNLIYALDNASVIDGPGNRVFDKTQTMRNPYLDRCQNLIHTVDADGAPSPDRATKILHEILADVPNELVGEWLIKDRPEEDRKRLLETDNTVAKPIDADAAISLAAEAEEQIGALDPTKYDSSQALDEAGRIAALGSLWKKRCSAVIADPAKDSSTQKKQLVFSVPVEVVIAYQEHNKVGKLPSDCAAVANLNELVKSAKPSR